MAVRKHPRNKEKSVKVPGMMTRFSWSRLRKRLSGTGTACEWKKLKQGGTGCSLPAQQSTGCVSECCCLTSGVCGDVVIPSALRGRTPALPSALLRCLPAAEHSSEGSPATALCHPSGGREAGGGRWSRQGWVLLRGWSGTHLLQFSARSPQSYICVLKTK